MSVEIPVEKAKLDDKDAPRGHPAAATHAGSAEILSGFMQLRFKVQF